MDLRSEEATVRLDLKRELRDHVSCYGEGEQGYELPFWFELCGYGRRRFNAKSRPDVNLENVYQRQHLQAANKDV